MAESLSERVKSFIDEKKQAKDEWYLPGVKGEFLMDELKGLGFEIVKDADTTTEISKLISEKKEKEEYEKKEELKKEFNI